MVEKRQDGAKSRSPGDAFSARVVRIFQLEGLLAAAGDAIASPLGQSTARWRVLAAIEHGPRAQIARNWKLARQSVQRLMPSRQMGSSRTSTIPTHRRAKLAELSPEGWRFLRRSQSKQEVWANKAGAAIGTRDLQVATDLLGRILATLERE